ncbi:unnamed protein product [Phytomonas sp. Hart1]|nr:unnamed protein product [Phytomonas sp. Hart1]|eukprot:CCW70244.1 unnamed protein product [Phytomonas sp. isolate Hart1]
METHPCRSCCYFFKSKIISLFKIIFIIMP